MLDGKLVVLAVEHAWYVIGFGLLLISRAALIEEWV